MMSIDTKTTIHITSQHVLKNDNLHILENDFCTFIFPTYAHFVQNRRWFFFALFNLKVKNKNTCAGRERSIKTIFQRMVLFIHYSYLSKTFVGHWFFAIHSIQIVFSLIKADWLAFLLSKGRSNQASPHLVTSNEMGGWVLFLQLF